MLRDWDPRWTPGVRCGTGRALKSTDNGRRLTTIEVSQLEISVGIRSLDFALNRKEEFEPEGGSCYQSKRSSSYTLRGSGESGV